jgi:hypothetical protein
VALTRSAAACKRKFLEIFPGGFQDPTYVDWERSYKWDAHRRWAGALGKATFRSLLDAGAYKDAATTAVRIESRTNLLFSFEKMAVRDAVATGSGARMFATGLYDWLHGPGRERDKFERWCETVAALPRRQTRVATWPVITVFGFIGRPRVHVFLKPTVTRVAAEAYGFDFRYHSRPAWDTYASLLDFARTVQRDVADLRPRDMIDIQSFIWVQGSAEYG